MKCRVYRNLDRPFTLLGIKGLYIPVALVGLLAIIIWSIVIGMAFGTFAGLASAVILIIAGYVGLLELQQRFNEKGLNRYIAGKRLPKFILTRSKVWRR